MIALTLIVCCIILFLLIRETNYSVQISSSLDVLLQRALEDVKLHQQALKIEQGKQLQYLECQLEIQKKLEHALGRIEEMQKGRLFDQTLLKESLDRAERYKRVLEAVLRSQGCDDAKIAFVLSQAENDADINDPA